VICCQNIGPEQLSVPVIDNHETPRRVGLDAASLLISTFTTCLIPDVKPDVNIDQMTSGRVVDCHLAMYFQSREQGTHKT